MSLRHMITHHAHRLWQHCSLIVVVKVSDRHLRRPRRFTSHSVLQAASDYEWSMPPVPSSRSMGHSCAIWNTAAQCGTQLCKPRRLMACLQGASARLFDRHAVRSRATHILFFGTHALPGGIPPQNYPPSLPSREYPHTPPHYTALHQTTPHHATPHHPKLHQATPHPHQHANTLTRT
jgi:hypothetical protein